MGGQQAWVALGTAWAVAAVAWSADGAALRAEADALLTQALLSAAATDVIRLAVIYRDPRAATLTRTLLDPLTTRNLEPALLDQLAGAAEVLHDTQAVLFLWRRITRGQTSPRLERALLALARPEHIPLIGYSVDDADYRLASLADAVLRRVGPLDPSQDARAYLRHAIAARSAWLSSRRQSSAEDVAQLAQTRALLRRHTLTAGLLGEPSAAPMLRGMLSGAEPGDQAVAVRALARLGDDAWRDWALARLRQPAPSARPPLDRIVAAELLAGDGDPVGRDLLLAWLHIGEDDVTVEALCALVRLATDAVAPGISAWRAAQPRSPHRALAALALVAGGDHTLLAEAWAARSLLARYDVDRDPPILPHRVLARALGLPIDAVPSGPVWAPPAMPSAAPPTPTENQGGTTP